ncbi:SagB/ThcOx family dehydrogenase [Aquisphaera insulae]|uniref:SagB/ThcOx family dehydrogenase n=1 Tax=Aquisphaera insulae TaxID=2712864 RepID=UPI0013EDA591|nr:SagB family peptide dehydrogenase [Aquisphaera insulae]
MSLEPPLAAGLGLLDSPGAPLERLLRPDRLGLDVSSDRWAAFLQEATARGFLTCSARQGDLNLATLLAISDGLELPLRDLELDRGIVLSRFAYSRRIEDRIVLESPRSSGRIILHHWLATAMVHELSSPCKAEELADRIPSLSPAAAAAMLALLVGAGFAAEPSEGAEVAEEERPPLQSWEFHDLLFHSRSRAGRHDAPMGPTYRLAGRSEPPPACRPGHVGESIVLERPDLKRIEREDPPFAAVVEARQSRREYVAVPISARELAEFLYRVGRIVDYHDAILTTERGPIRMDFASRPYPSAGCLHELELYVTIRACRDLVPGLYHYDGEEHRLIRIAGRTGYVDQMLDHAARCAGMAASSLQVLITIAARMPRVAWKYESIAYALVQKNVGVLYQTMYLTATAMNLAPCAIGAGNSDLFAKATTIDPHAEPAVGEFLLGSKP